MSFRIFVFVVAVSSVSLPSPLTQNPSRTGVGYDVKATATWREAREKSLLSPTGWLSVAGLFFLKPGVNLVGSDPSSDVPLPAGSAAAKVGRLIKEDQRVSFEPAPDANVRIDNVPVRTLIDLTRSTRLTAGRVTFFLHASGDRLAIRVRDPESELRRSFRGLRWFPVRPFWRITGRFVPFDAAKPVVFQNILGDLERYSSPGEVAFEVNGVQVRLQAVSSGERLWFIFSDATAGRDTYPIRFLYADAPAANGDVTLDFNRAYNPPCAYNPHTTCPRPPAGNFLKVPITAGEKRYSP